MWNQELFQFARMEQRDVPTPQQSRSDWDGNGQPRSRLSRLLEMLTLFRSGSNWNAPTLASWFGVSRTRVYNDIALLRSSGIPVLQTRNGYRLADGFLMPPLSLTLDESATLLLQMAFPSLVVMKDRNLVAATEKLLAGLPPEVRVQAHLLRTHVHVTDGRSGIPPHATSQLLISILERRRVAITGVPDEDRGTVSLTWSFLDPYGLIHDKGRWYVTGYLAEQHKVDTLRVADTWGIELTPLHFTVPKGFRIADHVPQVGPPRCAEHPAVLSPSRAGAQPPIPGCS